MYNDYNIYPFHSMPIPPWCKQNTTYNTYAQYPYPCYSNNPVNYSNYIQQNYGNLNNLEHDNLTELKDYGPEPFAFNINKATIRNNNYRTTLWTGDNLQLTLMSINPGEDIGPEIHPDNDQFIRIESGQGLVKMGDKKDNMYFQENVSDDYAFIIPAGTWHNLTNIGSRPIKLYSIYAPPKHPKGTINKTKPGA